MSAYDLEIKQGKYLLFCRIPKKARKKTYEWDVFNSVTGYGLGRVYWRSGWRQYVFECADYIDFNVRCLRDMASFIESQMQEHAKQWGWKTE